MELAVSALTTLCLSARVHSHSTLRWALSGSLLAIVGTVLTLVSPAFPMLIVTRLVAGIGAGVVGAEVTSVLSRGIDRERLIAIVTIISIVNAAFWLAILPYMIDRLGYRAPYICLLLICLSGAYLLLRVPALSDQGYANKQLSKSPFPRSAAFAVMAVFLTQLGQGAFWSLEESYGSNAGLNGHAIGIILSVATLMLLLGAVGAAWAGDRFGRFTSLFVLLAFNSLSIVLVSTIGVRWVYAGANILQAVTNLSCVIYQLGLSASLDRMGRAVAISTALVTLGNGIGPALAAYLSEVFGAPFVGVFVLALNGAAFGLFCMVMFRSAGEPQLVDSLPRSYP
jgi:MFS family permease